MVRVKYRYFLLELICADYGNEKMLQLPINGKELYAAIHAAICELYGDFGSGVLNDGLQVKMLNPYSRIVYLRTRRGPHTWLGSVLPFVTKIGNLQCSFKTIHLSGTLRSCHKSLQRFYNLQLPLLLSRCSSAEEKQVVQNSIRLAMQKDIKLGYKSKT